MQPDQMLLESEHGGTAGRLVAANAFKDAEAVVQRVADQMDLGVVPIDDLAVRPDSFGRFHPLVPVPATASVSRTSPSCTIRVTFNPFPLRDPP